MLSLQPSNHQGCHGEVHTGMPHKVACNKQVPCDVQAQCCKWPQLLHSCVNHCSKNKRQKTLTGTILLISPYMYISICVYTHTHTHIHKGLPQWLSCKESAYNGEAAEDMGSVPGLGRFPWRRAQQPTLLLFPGEYQIQRSLAGYSP